MAAKDHLHPILFHGSVHPSFKPGDEIHPTLTESHLGPTVHATSNPGWAGVYGHVYEVEPTDPQKLTSWGDMEGFGDEYVSTAPMRVVRRRSDLDYGEDHPQSPFPSFREHGKAEDTALLRAGMPPRLVNERRTQIMEMNKKRKTQG